MRFIINLILLLIIGLSAWRGYKKGMLVGICGILALVISIYGANLVATAYTDDYTSILDPFVSGYVETATGIVTDESTEEEEEGNALTKAYVQLSDGEKEDVRSVTFAVMRQCGVATDAANKIADEFAMEHTEVNYDLTNHMGTYLTERITFILLFAVVFIIIYIVFVVIENVLNLTLSIPTNAGMIADKSCGVVLGLIRAIILLSVVGCVLRYLGMFIGVERVDHTWLLNKFVNSEFIAGRLGV